MKTQKHEIIRVLSQNQVDIHLFKNLHIHEQLLINQMTLTEFFATETRQYVICMSHIVACVNIFDSCN